METLVRGQVVVLSFPFSNLEEAKKRPALILANPGIYNDLIVCMITAKPSELSVEINEADLLDGELRQPISYIRPYRIFSAEATVVDKVVATLRPEKMDEVLHQLAQIFGFPPNP